MNKLLKARLNEPTLVQLNQDGSLPTKIMILPVGKYDTYSGKIDITAEMLSQMVENFNAGVPNGVPINFDHIYGKAAGWVSSLVHKPGDTLYAWKRAWQRPVWGCAHQLPDAAKHSGAVQPAL